MPEIIGNVIQSGVDVAAALAFQETFSKEGPEAAERAEQETTAIAHQNRHAFFQPSGEGSVPVPNLGVILKW